MRKNKVLGQEGELLAKDYLEKKGYVAREQNLRIGRIEIDLVVLKDDLLVFVEVKTRSSTYFGEPEEAVDEAKANRILEASSAYLEDIDWKGNVRYDIVSIKTRPVLSIDHFEDAFY